MYLIVRGSCKLNCSINYNKATVFSSYPLVDITICFNKQNDIAVLCKISQ